MTMLRTKPPYTTGTEVLNTEMGPNMMENNLTKDPEIVTFKIAKLAKQKGYDSPCEYVYIYGEDEVDEFVRLQSDTYPDMVGLRASQIDSLNNGSYKEVFVYPAPSYQQLIKWIFDKLVCKKGSLSSISDICWLKDWFKVLNNCPLKYQLKGRLVEWFYDNGIWFKISKSKISVKSVHDEFKPSFKLKLKDDLFLAEVSIIDATLLSMANSNQFN